MRIVWLVPIGPALLFVLLVPGFLAAGLGPWGSLVAGSLLAGVFGLDWWLRVRQHRTKHLDAQWASWCVRCQKDAREREAAEAGAGSA